MNATRDWPATTPVFTRYGDRQTRKTNPLPPATGKSSGAVFLKNDARAPLLVRTFTSRNEA
ncbi:MAG: hypothetical protein D6714_00255 [Bacteroidetes bacterium]|nr:MAG: hypothetical protein D6714_00255 [Bacteroidota bacterium]